MVKQKMKNSGNDAPFFSVNLFRLTLLLLMPDLILSYGLPPYSSKRFDRSADVHFQAFDPISESYIEYHPPEYEYDATTLELPDEEAYNVLDKYSTIPVYGYYAGPDAPDRKENEAYGIIEDRPPGDPIVDLQEEMMEEDRRKHDYYSAKPDTWIEGEFPRYEGKEESRGAFPENLMMTQEYRDAVDDPKYGQHIPYVYPPPLEMISPAQVRDAGEEDDEREWYYGVPITEVDDSDDTGDGDDSVRELESLREKIRNPKSNIFKDSKAKAYKDRLRNAETVPVSKDKIILQLQKSIDGRKNYLPSEALELRKKQIYTSMESRKGDKFGKYFTEKDRSGREEGIGGKFPKAKERGEAEKAIEKETTTAPSTGKPMIPTETQTKGGQKEFVLPRPANPVRTTFNKGITPRATEQTSLYDTIKKILNMEEMLRQREKFQVKKRFVLNEDQLMSELSGLKKTAL